MKIIFYIVLLSVIPFNCSRGPDTPGQKRKFTDMEGRTILLPAYIKKTFSPSPMGTTLAYTFDPDLLLGWNYTINNQDKPYISPDTRELPVIGGWFGKTAGANIEILIRKKPDVIISVSTSGDAFDIDKSRMLGEKTGIPVAIFSMRTINDIPRIYTSMGELTGNSARATKLSNYASRLIRRTQKIVESIPPDKKINVYYAEGIKGLNTEPDDSMHAELIRFCGGNNVARVKENNISGYGNTPVSLEQVVAWNPDIILISDYLGKDGGKKGWRDIIGANPLWKKTNAVRNGRVFVIPRSPFQWIDRPPSVNRLAGLIWLPAIFYPDRCEYNLAKEIREFYSLFYECDLTEEDLRYLLDTNIYTQPQTTNKQGEVKQ